MSLAQAHDISRVLLIFSHDYYDEDINDLVQTIDFCKVMQVSFKRLLYVFPPFYATHFHIICFQFQIFYPYSIQTHPNEFPGIDPNDCPRDIKKDQ